MKEKKSKKKGKSKKETQPKDSGVKCFFTIKKIKCIKTGELGRAEVAVYFSEDAAPEATSMKKAIGPEKIKKGKEICFSKNERTKISFKKKVMLTVTEVDGEEDGRVNIFNDDDMPVQYIYASSTPSTSGEKLTLDPLVFKSKRGHFELTIIVWKEEQQAPASNDPRDEEVEEEEDEPRGGGHSLPTKDRIKKQNKKKKQKKKQKQKQKQKQKKVKKESKKKVSKKVKK